MSDVSFRPIILLPKGVLLLIQFSICQAELICLQKVPAYIRGMVEGKGNGALSFPGNTKKPGRSPFSDVSCPCDICYSRGGFLVECALFKLIT